MKQYKSDLRKFTLTWNLNNNYKEISNYLYVNIK